MLFVRFHPVWVAPWAFYAQRVNVEDLLTLLLRDPGRPRLTWYGPDDERIELSGAVLVNWVTKVANLLMTEHDAGPGFRVLLDLPGHWRTVVWALGVWRVGGCVVLSGAPGAVDLVVSSSGRAFGGVPTYAVALPGLALRWPGVLSDGVMDAGPAVMGQPDVMVVAPVVQGRAAAVADGAAVVAHADLLAPAGPAARPARGRHLIVLDRSKQTSGTTVPVATVLRDDGSAVLVSADTADRWRSEPGRARRVLDGEGVTLDGEGQPAW